MHRGFKFVFWGIETTLALVAGISEALIYEAYAPDDWAGVSAAFLRAGAMQLGIIVFGLAAVRAASQGKRSTQFMANVFSLGFSAISAWFVRESALAEKHLNFLQPAYNQPLIIPFWGSVGGQSIDPTLVGAIPFLIWAVNVFAPIILNDGKVIYHETEAEMQARFKREEIEQAHKNRMRAIGAKGWRDALTGAVTGANGEGEQEEQQEVIVTQAPPPPAAHQSPAVAGGRHADQAGWDDDESDEEAAENLQPVLVTSGVAVNGQNGAHMSPPAGSANAAQASTGSDTTTQRPPAGKSRTALPAPDTKAFKKLVMDTANRLLDAGTPLSFFNIAQEMGAKPEDVRTAIEDLKAQRLGRLRPGKQLPPDPVLDVL